MLPVVLFRGGVHERLEIASARKRFEVVTRRTECRDRLVIGRYSCLPYYRELEDDLKYNGCRLVNSWEQHRWIAEFEWYVSLRKYTMESWHDNVFYACEYPGPFVVKGVTNSRKHQWNTHMYAETKSQANKVASELRNDMFLGDQRIVFRKYVPLKTYEVGLNGVRFANEWRFFYMKEMRLSYGYYWSPADDHARARIDADGLAFADAVAREAAKHANFFVLDIAEKEEGGWVLVEVNDGQMSGLSENSADLLYHNLKSSLFLVS